MEKSCFPRDAIGEIFRYSRGIPRLINIVCDNSLLIGYAIGQEKIKRKIVQEAIDDLESGQRRFGRALESRAIHSTKKPKESRIEKSKEKSAKKATPPLTLWPYVLLSRIYLFFFGAGRNKGRVFNHGKSE
jgi:hypothetical protein